MCDDSHYILDELFWKERNVVANKRKNDGHNWNQDICKNILVSKFFNDLWKHTKYDHEGKCSKRHDQFFINEFNCDRSIKKQQREKTCIEKAIATSKIKLKEVDKILTTHADQVEQSSKLQVTDRPKEIQDRLDNMERYYKKDFNYEKILDEEARKQEFKEIMPKMFYQIKKNLLKIKKKKKDLDGKIIQEIKVRKKAVTRKRQRQKQIEKE